MQWKKALKLPPLRQCACLLLGTAILSFGLYYIHRQSGVTEGGVLGLVLLLNHHFHWPAHVMTPILDGLCYLLGWRFLGWEFMKRSVIATLGMTGFYKLWSLLPPLIPGLSSMPLAAALIGCVCVGVGVGLVVRMGGSAGGDDALALVISKAFRCDVSRAYMITDFIVLMLSLSYIPVRNIACSLVTVTLSSFIIGWIHRLGKKKAE